MTVINESNNVLGLDGRTVVVAGAGAGGIGEAVVSLLTSVGVRVVAIDRDRERLQQTEEIVASEGGSCRAIVADVCDQEQIAAAIAAVRADGWVLHGLVHVVGGLPRDRWRAFAEYPAAWFDEVLRTNLSSTVLTSQAVVQALLEQGTGGSIVHIASLSGLAASPFATPYGAAKAAVINLTMSLAVELGSAGIRVNAVAPGTIVTTKSADPEDDAGRAAIPLGRRGLPREIAGAALYLLSDLATFVSGQVLAVDGGSSVKPSYLDEVGIPVFLKDPALRARLTGAGEVTD
jgi:NAD(P)-dependent dehydrogenase (short-subunit alcohol dehydrogenase family)